MTDDSQIIVPPSFLVLYTVARNQKLSISREELNTRYEFCEDLATMLVDTAQQKMWDLGLPEADVLERLFLGLLAEGTPVTLPEARWVLCRLAELLGWPQPTFESPPGEPQANWG